MTNQQLYLAIGVPIVVNMLFNGFVFFVLDRRITNEIAALNARIASEVASLKELWRAELVRVEQVLDARLKHLEERSH
jgi:hypothetical protein